MSVLGAMVRTTQTYPALLPLILLTACVAIWARRRRRPALMVAAVVVAAIAVFLYTGRSPIEAMGQPPAPRPPAAGRMPGPAGRTPSGAIHVARLLHPRFPDDFEVPTFFLHEHTRGRKRHGALTVRFRFQGSPEEAVRDLAESGRRNGWTVTQGAPHRLLFSKGKRTVEAWFSFPGHSLVLDIPDPR